MKLFRRNKPDTLGSNDIMNGLPERGGVADLEAALYSKAVPGDVPGEEPKGRARLLRPRAVKPPKEPKAPKPARAPRAGRGAKATKTPKAPKAPKERKRDFEVLSHCARLPFVSHRKLLLTGHTLFATLDASKGTPNDQFVTQQPRQTAPGLQTLLGRKTAQLRVSVDGRLLDRPRTRYAFAIDGYLAWGKRHGHGSTVLLGGVDEADGTYLDVMVFQDRVLVESLERELPASEEAAFGLTLTTLLEELSQRYPSPRVVAAAPLRDWQRTDIEYLGSKPLQGLSFLPLSAKSMGPAGLRATALAVLAGLGIYTGMMVYGWAGYEAAGKKYLAEASDPALEKSGGINNARLDTMQQQRMFMGAERQQVELAARVQRVAGAIAALPDVRITELTLHARPLAGVAGASATTSAGPVTAGEGEAAPDVKMVLVAPLQGAAALDQARGLMQAIAAATGLQLRLAPGGWSDDANAGTRTLTIEGFDK